MNEWTGSVLYVDLSREIIKVKPLDRDEAVNFIGGRGLNIKRLFLK